jgi:hypothetical protein
MEFTKEIEEKLKAPFAPEHIKSRPMGGKKLHYIDARNVMDRLDEVVGMDNWSNEFWFEGNRTICELTILGVTKMDGAGDTSIEGEKGGLSDALKRSAVMFGIGRYLYEGRDPRKVYEEYQRDSDEPGAKAVNLNSLEDLIEACESLQMLEDFRKANLTALKSAKNKDELLKLYNDKKESF